MAKSKMILFGSVFVIAAMAGVLFFQSRSAPNFGSGVEVDWKLLGELDYITGKAPSELQALDGKEVRIPGFMVPLEDDMKRVSEFLLVPSPQACIHVPPPPPNQMVLVEMDVNSHAQVQFGPIWIYGKLSLHSKRHMYGEASFTLHGMKITPYR